uniref:Transposase MuDR plant domain-containing protein n=1 Tax=Lactuca sativa TaxID=4236 RepID=A0A9R1WZY5_LACSA|nr:hypothetical protein LSAT_V11C700377310 [Lactuca sativa]
MMCIPTSKFKIKLKYWDTFLLKLRNLHEEVTKRYLSKNNTKFSNLYVNKFEPHKTIVTVYVKTENNLSSNNHSNHLCGNRDEAGDEDDRKNYHSHLSSDSEEDQINDDDEVNSVSKNNISMIVNLKFENALKMSLNIQKTYLTCFTGRCENLECEWRIHASITLDEVTFEVKKMVEVHTCTRSNKGGNKRATQGCIANVVTAKLKYDGISLQLILEIGL